ncbi:TIC 55, chloroplastic [Seminavis robusta]|uniref:TIC 55, chloroplastic n=1 Tax=Seminavis robusta TaxID=568900 RepID=A0A9N8DK50_9STRA|nr:TIC 55, chloroplastic [Seminavis robusta]|eukprot:Sro172_g076020.1 TIC 55, chloroplastic (426) ;mRNA; f:59661-60938
MNAEETLQEWFPLSFQAYLKQDWPNAVLHMGRPLVVWRSAEGTWFAQDDMCPHKLAPLSDGSITATGDAIRCSLHGWQFQGCGTCSMIPSLPANASIPGNKKYAVRSFPIRQRGDCLWIWMDPSVPPDENHPRMQDASWELKNGYQRELPYSWDFLFENILDPTHVAYAHCGVGKEFNRTEVDDIRENHVTNLQTRSNNLGVQLKFDRTINGRTANETWDFLYPGVWFLRRNTSETGPAGVIVASPIDTNRVRIMSGQYNPNPPPETKKKQSWKAKLQRQIFTVVFHRSLNKFFNSDAFLLRYPQDLIAAACSENSNPLSHYELASPADQGTVAFRRWHRQRLGGKLPMANPSLLPKIPRQIHCRTHGRTTQQQHYYDTTTGGGFLGTAYAILQQLFASISHGTTGQCGIGSSGSFGGSKVVAGS